MSLPNYQELPCALDAQGNGVVTFTPWRTYGTASLTLSVVGANLTGNGYIYLGNNPLGPCLLAQGFGPFNVNYGQPVKVVVSGGPPNVVITLALKGAIYQPGEAVPAENLQFSAVTQQNSNVLVRKQNIALAGTLTYGPFDVSKFAGLNLLCETNGQSQVVLSWTDVDGVTPLGASQWDMAKDVSGNGVYKVMDVAANLGPKVTLEIVPNGATQVASLSLVPSATPLIGPTGTTLGAVCENNGTVADAGTLTAEPNFISAGPAVLSLVNEFDGKSWELQLWYVKADQTTHLIVSHVGTSKDYQVGVALPAGPCVVKYYNNSGDGTSQDVQVALIKSSKGAGQGLPGPQGKTGPAGPSGSGGGLGTGPISGLWYQQGGGSTLPAQSIPNATYYFPIYVGFPFTAQALALVLTSVGAGATMELGIYSNANGVPGNLLVSTGTVSATTGFGSHSITATALSPGLYFGAVSTSNTATFTCRGIGPSSLGGIFVPAAIPTASNAVSGYRFSNGGSLVALPATAPSMSGTDTSSSYDTPLLYIQAA